MEEVYWSQCGITSKRFLARVLTAILSSFLSTSCYTVVARLHLECLVDFLITKLNSCKLTFSYSKADWNSLRELLHHIPWHSTFLEDGNHIFLGLPGLTSTSFPGSLFFSSLELQGRDEERPREREWSDLLLTAKDECIPSDKRNPLHGLLMT